MIIVVFGLPGTGKTYFSKRLQKNIGAVHLNTDTIRKQLHKTGNYNRETKQFIYQELLQTAGQHLNQGSDVIIDGTFHKEERREMVRRLSETTHQSLFFIEIAATETSVHSRLAFQREDSEANFEVYQKLKTDFDAFSQAHLTLWSDSDTIEKMISKAKTYIHEHQSDKQTGKPGKIARE